MANATDPTASAPKKIAWSFAFTLVFFGALWSFLPSRDPEAYFNFADKRMLYGLPNFFDVISNVMFIYVGLFGLFVFFRKYSKREKDFWEPLLLMSLGILITGWGSSYFHLDPSPATLVWDRLPMTLVFSSLLTLVLVDRAEVSRHRRWMLALTAAALASAWNTAYGLEDLRLYIFVQFGFSILILLFLFLFGDGFIGRGYFLISLGLYVAAKVCEFYDHQIYGAFFLSGHTLKHMLSAVALFFIYWGVLRTKPARPTMERRRRNGAILF